MLPNWLRPLFPRKSTHRRRPHKSWLNTNGFVQLEDRTTPSVVSINNVTLNEGNSGTTDFQFTISLDVADTQDILVDFATQNGTAIAGSDYIANSGTATIKAGDTSTTIDVFVNGNTIVQPDRTFLVNLSSPTGGSVAPTLDPVNNVGTGKITNDDTAMFSIVGATANEGSAAVFTINLSNPVSTQTTVQFTTANGTANNSNYTPVNQTIVFPALSTSQTVNVSTIQDNVVNTTLNFTASLSNAQAAGQPAGSVTIDGANSTATGNVVNIDTAQFSITGGTTAEGGTQTFTINLSKPVATATSVTFSTSDNTAIAGTNYTAVNNSVVSFPALSQTQTINVSTLTDNVVTPTLKYLGNLVALNNAGFSQVTLSASTSASGFITNTDTAQFSVTGGSVNEGGIATFTVSLSNPVSVDTSVVLTTSDGPSPSAIAGTNYQFTQTTVTFLAGSTAPQNVSVQTLDDNIVNTSLQFTGTLGSLNNGGIPQVTISGIAGSAVGTINNIDTAQFSISGGTIAEGGLETFRITLSNKVATATAVNFTTADGTAIAGTNYNATTTAVNFGAFDTSKTVTVQTIDDNLVTGPLDFTGNITLTNDGGFPALVSLGTSSATGTITNVDTAVFSITGGTNIEGGLVTFTINLSNPVSTDTAVSFSTSDLTAISGTNYNSVAAQTVTFTKGTTTQTVSVQTNVDNVVTPTLKFAGTITLQNNGGFPTFVSVGPSNSANGNITNTDTTLISITGDVQNEGTANHFTLTLSNPVSVDTSVQFATSSITAVSGVNFTSVNSTFTILANTTTLDIPVTTVDDNIVNNSLLYLGTISNPTATGVTVGQITTGIGIAISIISNITTAQFSISGGTIQEGGLETFTISLNNKVATPTQVMFSTLPGTAIAGTNYNPSTQFVTFPALSNTPQTVTVQTLADNVVTPTLSFTGNLALTGDGGFPAFVTVNPAASQATGLITNTETATLSINNVTLNRSPGGTTTNYAFQVTLNRAVASGFNVNYTTVDGTAQVALGDYIPNSGTLSFAGNAGEVQTINVTVNGTDVVELDKIFTIALSGVSPNDAGIPASSINASATGTGTIINVNTATVSITGVANATEGAGIAFTISLSRQVDAPVTVNFNTQDGTALAVNGRYLPIVNQLVTFNAFTTTQIVTVTTVDNRIVEGTESITGGISTLNNAGRAVSLNPAIGTGNILDNDTASINFGSAADTIVEANSTRTVNVVLTLNTSGTGPIGLSKTIVAHVASSGTASNGTDPANGAQFNFPAPIDLTFSPATGNTFSQSISFTTFENIAFNGNTTAVFTATVQSDGTSGQASTSPPNPYVLTIQDNDTPTARIYNTTVAGTYVAQINGGTGKLELTLNGTPIANDTLGNYSLTVNGVPGQNCFEVNYINGSPMPGQGITFNATGGNSTAAVIGTNAQSGTYSAGVNGDGTIAIVSDPGSTRFTGVNGIDITKFSSLTVSPTIANTSLTLADGKSVCINPGNIAAVNVAGTSGGQPITPASIWNTGTLNVDTSTVLGPNTITLNTLNGITDNVGALNLNTFKANTDNSGNSITVSQAASVTFNDAIGMTSGDSIDIGLSSTLTSNTGSISLTSSTSMLAISASLNATGGTINANFGASLGTIADFSFAKLNATNTTITGGSGNDTVIATGYDIPVIFDGGNPATLPGDTFVFLGQRKALSATSTSFKTGVADVKYVNFETVKVIDPGAFTLNGLNTSNVLTIAGNDPTLNYTLNTNTPVTVSGAPSFSFNGGVGQDLVTVNLANGNPLPAGNNVIDGLGGNNDGICILGTGTSTGVVTAIDSSRSKVDFDNRSIQVQGFTPTSRIDMTQMANETVQFQVADVALNIDAGKDATAGKINDAMVISGTSFISVGLWKNQNVSIITDRVGAAGDNNSVAISSITASQNNTNVTIATGTGTDLITVSGPVTIAGNLLLDGPVAITNTVNVSAGNITFNRNVDGPGTLNTSSAGTTTFQGAVGSGKALASLTTAAQGSTVINGAAVNVNGGAMTFGNPVTFSSNTSFLNNGGSITFNGTLEPTTAGLNLTVGGTGTSVTFAKDIGSQKAVGSVTIPTASDVTINAIKAASLTQQAGTGTTTLNGDTNLTGAASFTNINNLNINGALNASGLNAQGISTTTLNGDTNLTGLALFTNMNNLNVNGALNASGLTAQSIGTTTLNGGTNLTGLASFTSINNLNINGTLNASGLDVQATGTVKVAGNTTTNSSGVSITANTILLPATLASKGQKVTLTGLTAASSITQSSNNVFGKIVADSLSLQGSGKFDLSSAGNQLTNATSQLFVNLASGNVQVRNDLPFILAVDNTVSNAITITNGGNVTLIAGTDFTANTYDDVATSTMLFNIGAGTFQVYPGVIFTETNNTSASVKTIFKTDGVAGKVILGTDLNDPVATDPKNIANDRFTVRPLTGSPLFVNGNLPLTLNASTNSFDSLIPAFTNINNIKLQSTGNGSGIYTFSGFLNLQYQSIESIGGLQVQAFAVQTGPRSDSSNNEFAVRLFSTQQNLDSSSSSMSVDAKSIALPIDGTGTISNPFVVSPQLVNPIGRYSPPQIVLADIFGNGVPDLIIANGSGDAPLITIVKGSSIFTAANSKVSSLVLQNLDSSQIIAQFYAFEPTFFGGINVTVANLDSSGVAQIVVGAKQGGGPRVRIFQIDKNNTNYLSNVTTYSGTFGQNKLSDFFAVPDQSFINARGGVNVAIGDLNGDGTPDLIVGAGIGGGPRVTVYSGKDGTVIRDFFAFEDRFRGGVLVQSGRFDGDNRDDLLVAPGIGGGPRIRIFDGAQFMTTETTLADFYAFPDPNAGNDSLGGTSLNNANAYSNGVGGISFADSTDVNGNSQAILISSPRGARADVVRFTYANITSNPAAPVGSSVYASILGTQTIQSKNNVNALETLDQNALLDGVTVAGFAQRPGTSKSS